MGYANHEMQQLGVQEKTADDLSATGDNLVVAITYPVTVYELAAQITTAVVSTAAVIVKADKTPAVSGSRGDGDVGIITIPAAQAAAKVVIKKLDPPVDLVPGDIVTFEVTTAAAGGGAAGGARYFLHVRPRDEVSGNLTGVTESA